MRKMRTRHWESVKYVLQEIKSHQSGIHIFECMRLTSNRSIRIEVRLSHPPPSHTYVLGLVRGKTQKLLMLLWHLIFIDLIKCQRSCDSGADSVGIHSWKSTKPISSSGNELKCVRLSAHEFWPIWQLSSAESDNRKHLAFLREFTDIIFWIFSHFDK